MDNGKVDDYYDQRSRQQPDTKHTTLLNGKSVKKIYHSILIIFFRP